MNYSSIQSPTSTFSIGEIVERVNNGTLKIPQFQRDFVWTLSMAASLLDSVLRRYPIGSLILWETKEKLHAEKEIGGLSLPPTPSGQCTTYVLDGQQRVTTLFAALRGLKIKRGNKTIDFSTLIVDFTAKSGDDWVVVDSSAYKEDEKLRLNDLFIRNFKNLNPDFAERAAQWHQQLNKAKDLSAIMLTSAPAEIATEVFERINTHGKKLTVFDVMVAKTFSEEPNFDLGEKFRVLDAEFQASNFRISSSVVLQAACVIISKEEPSRKNILAINKKSFIDGWPRVEAALRKATDYLRNDIGVPNSRLLPYEALVVAFAFAFDRTNCNPNLTQRKWLQHYFWTASLSNRYEAHVESNLAQDIKQLKEVVNNNLPNFGTFEFEKVCGWLAIHNRGQFNLNSAYIKALVCLLLGAEPRSFFNSKKVVIEDVLHRSNGRNYHHFFPKNYLKKVGVSYEQANHIANITLLVARENQSWKDKSPEEFFRSHIHSAEMFKSQFIDLKSQDKWIASYNEFTNMRCKLLSKAIKAKLIL